MWAKKSDISKTTCAALYGLSAHAACEVGGEGANATSPRPSRRKLYGLSSHAACEVRGRGPIKPSPRPSRRNIVCMVLYMSLVVVNID